MAADMNQYDFSEYPKDHHLYSEINKKKVGLMKDEMNGDIIAEFVGIRAKQYSVLTEKKKEILKAKGVKYLYTKTHFNHQIYKNCVLENYSQQAQFNLIRSNKHDISSITQTKNALCNVDNKKY